MEEHVRRIHEENKREMFDAMRAYHESELAHKQDAISLLTTVLTATGTIYVAIIGAKIAASAGKLASSPAIPFAAIAWGTAAGVSAAAIAIVLTTNYKIKKDHELYAQFGAEYQRECEILGLFNSVTVDSAAIQAKVKPKSPIGTGKGYKYTQRILWGVGLTVVFLAVVGCWFVHKLP